MPEPRGFHAEKRQPKSELREMLERDARRVFAGGVLTWMDRLTRARSQANRGDAKMSRQKELGAAFVPAVLFGLLAGCNDPTTVDCSDDEANYLEAATDWVVNHPDEIEAQMDVYWPDRTISGEQLVSTLSNAEIVCGVKSDSVFAGEGENSGYARMLANTVVVLVDNELFQENLDLFLEGQWTEDFTFNELVTLYQGAQGQERTDIWVDFSIYNTAVYTAAEILAHEGAHLGTGIFHSPAAEKKAGELAASGDQESIDQLASIDQVFAWGRSAYTVGEVENHELLASFDD